MIYGKLYYEFYVTRHAEWRKLVKKLRRKRIRTMLAVALNQQLTQGQFTMILNDVYKLDFVLSLIRAYLT